MTVRTRMWYMGSVLRHSALWMFVICIGLLSEQLITCICSSADTLCSPPLVLLSSVMWCYYSFSFPFKFRLQTFHFWYLSFPCDYVSLSSILTSKQKRNWRYPFSVWSVTFFSLIHTREPTRNIIITVKIPHTSPLLSCITNVLLLSYLLLRFLFLLHPMSFIGSSVFSSQIRSKNFESISNLWVDDKLLTLMLLYIRDQRKPYSEVPWHVERARLPVLGKLN